MEIKRPLLLISNDDGYLSKGIRCLAEMLSDMGDIIVCAPDDARSGYSCAFSASRGANNVRVLRSGPATVHPSTA